MPKDERPYAPMDLGLPRHPKLRGADGRAKWLYAATILWCNAEYNDGIFEPRVAVVVADVPPRFVQVLIDRDVWHEKGHHCDRCPQPAEAGDLVVHDFPEHNRTARQIRKLRSDRKLAGRKGNHDRWKKQGHRDHQGEFEDCEKCNV